MLSGLSPTQEEPLPLTFIVVRNKLRIGMMVRMVVMDLMMVVMSISHSIRAIRGEESVGENSHVLPCSSSLTVSAFPASPKTLLSSSNTSMKCLSILDHVPWELFYQLELRRPPLWC